jgi:hypothetical protein
MARRNIEKMEPTLTANTLTASEVSPELRSEIHSNAWYLHLGEGERKGTRGEQRERNADDRGNNRLERTQQL